MFYINIYMTAGCVESVNIARVSTVYGQIPKSVKKIMALVQTRILWPYSSQPLWLTIFHAVPGQNSGGLLLSLHIYETRER